MSASNTINNADKPEQQRDACAPSPFHHTLRRVEDSGAYCSIEDEADDIEVAKTKSLLWGMGDNLVGVVGVGEDIQAIAIGIAIIVEGGWFLVETRA